MLQGNGRGSGGKVKVPVSEVLLGSDYGSRTGFKYDLPPPSRKRRGSGSGSGVELVTRLRKVALEDNYDLQIGAGTQKGGQERVIPELRPGQVRSD